MGPGLSFDYRRIFGRVQAKRASLQKVGGQMQIIPSRKTGRQRLQGEPLGGAAGAKSRELARPLEIPLAALVWGRVTQLWPRRG